MSKSLQASYIKCLAPAQARPPIVSGSHAPLLPHSFSPAALKFNPLMGAGRAFEQNLAAAFAQYAAQTNRPQSSQKAPKFQWKFT